VWLGTREGGAFESQFLLVSELDASGWIRRLDFYDTHRLEAALARFDEINAITPRAVRSNIARWSRRGS
jgi:hypothetical protein